MIFRTPHLLPLPRLFAPSDLLPKTAGQRRAHRSNRGGISTIASLSRLSGTAEAALLRTVRRGRREIATWMRDSGLLQNWRFLLLSTLLSFAAAWMGTKAVMAQFENAWTKAALTAARHENQELRTRQETLREETEAAFADLAAAEARSRATPAGYP